MLTSRLKKHIIGSPIESFARRVSIRINPSMYYDRQTIAIMRRCLDTKSNCVDVGAYRGTILREIIQIAPNGLHFVFEPIPTNYQYLIRKFPNVRVFNIALSNKKTSD
jgi:hypothetical protein